MYTRQILIMLLAGFALGGCETPTSANGFRNSVHQNLAVQIINPEPAAEPATAPTSGVRVALALKRYQEGRVIEPRTLKIGQSGGGKSGKSN